MSVLSIIVLTFSVLGALDYVLGNKFGLGKEFERSFSLLGVMAISMVGMIVIAPLIASALSPVFNFVYNAFGLDPSIIPAMLFANDMGGDPLAAEVAKDYAMGQFNGLVVSSMMGATVSYSIPVSLGLVKKENHRSLLIGLLCGLVTIPIGCFVGGVCCSLPILPLLGNLIPLIIFSLVIAAGLWFFPNACIKIFSVFGFLIKLLIMVGFVLGIINFLANETIIEGIATVEEGALICFNACVTMTGMFPLISIVSRLTKKPLTAVGKKVGINDVAALGVITSMASGTVTFGLMDKMNSKGIAINGAFAVSGAFTFAAHLAYTMARDPAYILPVIVGKLVAGFAALVIAFLLYDRLQGNKKKQYNE